PPDVPVKFLSRPADQSRPFHFQSHPYRQSVSARLFSAADFSTAGLPRPADNSLDFPLRQESVSSQSPSETFPGTDRPLPACCRSDSSRKNKYPHHILL